MIEQPAASCADFVGVESEQAEDTSKPTATRTKDLNRFPILSQKNLHCFWRQAQLCYSRA